MWNCPYSNDSFGPYAEDIDGASSQVLLAAGLFRLHRTGMCAQLQRNIHMRSRWLLAVLSMMRVHQRAIGLVFDLDPHVVLALTLAR